MKFSSRLNSCETRASPHPQSFSCTIPTETSSLVGATFIRKGLTLPAEQSKDYYRVGNGIHGKGETVRKHRLCPGSDEVGTRNSLLTRRGTPAPADQRPGVGESFSRVHAHVGRAGRKPMWSRWCCFRSREVPGIFTFCLILFP